MPEELKWQTVPDSLARVLRDLMRIEEFSSFRLVGGTSLCLQLGHRESYDIDMFTDLDYGSLDWESIDKTLRSNFEYVSEELSGIHAMGITRFLRNASEDIVKLDLYYTDAFIRNYLLIQGIRLAGLEDIVAMKLAVISTAGRKRDFWDIHEFLEIFGLNEMIILFNERYPYHNIRDVIHGLCDFSRAENDDDPVCYKGKFWDLIKIDIEKAVNEYLEGERTK